MCEAFNVSRSGYYAYVNRPESKRSQENKKLLETIKQINEEKAVFEYMELFYNRRRTHSSNDYILPFKLKEPA